MTQRRHAPIPLTVLLDAQTIAYVEEWADISGLTRTEALTTLVVKAISRLHPDLIEASAEMKAEEEAEAKEFRQSYKHWHSWGTDSCDDLSAALLDDLDLEDFDPEGEPS